MLAVEGCADPDGSTYKLIFDRKPVELSGMLDLTKAKEVQLQLYASNRPLPQNPNSQLQLMSINMDLTKRRSIEKRIIIAAAEGLVTAGGAITVTGGKKIFIADSKDPVAIEAALHESEEPCFLVKRAVDGKMQEGWVDFVGYAGIEVTADENLEAHEVLLPANILAIQLGVQGIGRKN